MNTFPDGYTCGQCGTFVGWNATHQCPGLRARSASVSANPFSDTARIAKALEKIAATLEKIETRFRYR